MVITNRSQKLLTLFALAMAFVLLTALTLSTANRISKSQTGTASIHAGGATASALNGDYYDGYGGYRPASGRQLWQLETQPHNRCIAVSRNQQIVVNALDTYAIVDVNGRAVGGGQYAARILRLGTIAAC